MIHKNTQVNIRMPYEKYSLLKRACELRGEDISDFIRRAVYSELGRMSLLSTEEKKMLGLLNQAGRGENLA